MKEIYGIKSKFIKNKPLILNSKKQILQELFSFQYMKSMT